MNHSNTTYSYNGLSIQNVCKIFGKTIISYLLIHRRRCAYQGVRNNSFYESFGDVLNAKSLTLWMQLAIKHARSGKGKCQCNMKKYFRDK